MKITPKIQIRIAVAIAFLVLIVCLWPVASHYLNPAFLAEKESAIREGYSSNPVLFFIVWFFAYLSAIAVGLPGSSNLSVITGWLFGLVKGVLLVSFAATIGSVIAFLLARYCLRGLIEKKFGKQLDKFQERFGDDCPSCLFSMRLLPGIPNIFINMLPALTQMKATTFAWVSQLGMLPGTIAFIYVGSELPSLQKIAEDGVAGLISPGLVLGLAAIGLLPLLMRFILGKFGAGKPTQTTTQN